MRKLLFQLLAVLLPAISILTPRVALADVVQVGCGASLQAAYDALPNPTGGVLYLQACRYDVSPGLRLNRGKPVSIVGPARWRRHVAREYVDDPRRIPTAIIFSSTTPTGSGYLVDTTRPSSLLNGQGFEFRNLMFDTDNAAGAILGDNVSHAVVGNSFFALGRADAWAIKLVTKDSFVQPGTPHGDDASWWRIEDNNSQGGGFFCACGAEGGTTQPYLWNHNQHVITGNVVFAPNSPVMPAIWCRGCHRTYIAANNLEGEFNPAILLESTWQSRLDGNGGEAGTTAGLVFAKLVDSDANFLSDMGTSTSEGQILYFLDSASSDNVVIAAALTNTRDLYGAGGIVNLGASNLINARAGAAPAPAPQPIIVIAAIVAAIVAVVAAVVGVIVLVLVGRMTRRR
jgi:hypothetical protein